MKITKLETAFNGKYLRFKRKHFITKKGRRDVWEFLERKLSFGPSVIIFALTEKKEVLIEKIYRVPFENWVLELPAGNQDRKGESEKETARRELLEETGYKAKKMTLILKGPISSSIIREEVSYYFAPDVELKARPSREDVEEIEVLKVPIGKLVDFILNQSSEIRVDPKILTILPILKKKRLI